MVVDKRTASTVGIPSFEPERRQATIRWPVDLEKLKAKIETMSVERLYEYYRATVDFDFANLNSDGTADVGQIVRNVVMVLDQVLSETKRRGLWGKNAKNEDYIRWPSTKTSGGDGSMVLDDLLSVGPLSALGYRVGKNAEGPRQRCSLLTRAFRQDLPRVAGVEEWGENESLRRLRKMAESIAAFARNAKHRYSASYADAIRMWEHDLEYLRVTHYVGRFDNKGSYPTT